MLTADGLGSIPGRELRPHKTPLGDQKKRPFLRLSSFL